MILRNSIKSLHFSIFINFNKYKYLIKVYTGLFCFLNKIFNNKTSLKQNVSRSTNKYHNTRKINITKIYIIDIKIKYFYSERNEKAKPILNLKQFRKIQCILWLIKSYKLKCRLFIGISS